MRLDYSKNTASTENAVPTTGFTDFSKDTTIVREKVGFIRLVPHTFMTEGGTQEKPVGTVVHWYDKVGVAVVKLASMLKLGDRIKIKRGEEEFEDSVTSMQLDHQPIDAGKKGQEVAVKLSREAREGASVFKA